MELLQRKYSKKIQCDHNCMREKINIPEEQLLVCLQEQYNLIPVTVDFLPLGHDMRAGVYRVVSEHGASYLLKAKFGSLYEPGCFVPRYLHDLGIAAVVAPLPTKNNALWTQLGNWSFILYPFIDGDTSLMSMTEKHWKEVGTTFRQIHQAVLPHVGFELLRKETFDLTEYAHWVRAFELQHVRSEGGSVLERALRTSWLAHQPTIHSILNSLERLAEVLRERSGPYVICHADLHPANLIRNYADHVFVIDWDDVMLAPKERDFIFVKETSADGLAGTSPFFQGYGQRQIDWIALTYYRYERVIQDVIEYAREVFFRHDLSEETKAHSVQSFHANIEGRMVAAAYAAASHIPSNLIF